MWHYSTEYPCTARSQKQIGCTSVSCVPSAFCTMRRESSSRRVIGSEVPASPTFVPGPIQGQTNAIRLPHKSRDTVTKTRFCGIFDNFNVVHWTCLYTGTLRMPAIEAQDEGKTIGGADEDDVLLCREELEQAGAGPSRTSDKL